jgi:hypothetical protein
MSQTVTSPRLLVLSVEPTQVVELAKIAGGVFSGALGLRLWDRIAARFERKKREPVELTARILDDGDKFREVLLARAERLSVDKDLATERAHRAETELAIAKGDLSRLSMRLTRKDEALKALHNQIISLGRVPVTMGENGGLLVTDFTESGG